MPIYGLLTSTQPQSTGIMNGRGNGFAPSEPITRAEVAVVAERLLKQMGK
ncbi:S-layer homology domain-containing protein [Paenibacillus apiarius]